MILMEVAEWIVSFIAAGVGCIIWTMQAGLTLGLILLSIIIYERIFGKIRNKI